MPRTAFPFSSKGRTLVLSVAATGALLLTAVGAKAWLFTADAVSSAPGPVATTGPDPAATADQPGETRQSIPNPARLESERITVRPTGFEPAEITRPAGRVLLAVNDRSGLGALTLRLDAGPGVRLREVRVPQDTRGRHEWRQVVNFPPGTYVVTEANHPGWVCRITITPN